MSTLDIDPSARSDGAALTRVEETVNSIREDIIAGTLTPGAKLAVEHLRQRYGVARMLSPGFPGPRRSGPVTVAPLRCRP